MTNGLTRLADALPRRARARRRSCSAHAGAYDARGGRGGRPGHRRRRRHRLRGRGAHRRRGARQPLARRADRHGGEPALRRRRDHARPRSSAGSSAWQNWIFQRPNAVGERGALTLYGTARAARASTAGGPDATSTSTRRSRTTSTCRDDRRLQRALENVAAELHRVVEGDGARGLPGRRRSTCARRSPSTPSGWANFDYVKMPDYRWGIFLAPPEQDRTIALRRPLRRAGLAGGPGRVPQRAAAHHRDPGRHRAGQRRAAAPARRTPRPSLYDCATCSRSTSRRAGTCGRWSTCCTRYFGRDGREEAEELLERRSGDADKPRILTTFNEPIDDWLVVLHVHDVHRPRRQVPAAGAGRERLRPAVAHDALHADRGGAPHVRRRDRRRPRRRARLRADEARTPTRTSRAQGGIDLDDDPEATSTSGTRLSLDLFGGEISSQRRRLLRRRPQGPRQGGEVRGPRAPSTGIYDDGRASRTARSTTRRSRCATR